jgi:hypothetical protein
MPTSPPLSDTARAAPRDTEAPLTVWAVTDGRAGMEAQAAGLAEALAALRPADLTVLRQPLPGVAAKLPERALAPLARRWPGLFLDEGAPAGRPLPDVAIGCGRAGLAVVLAAKARARTAGRFLFAVQTQDPRIGPAAFDLVVPPAHDGLTGPNVLPILGSPNRVTPERLASARADWTDRLASLPRPLLAGLIGGPSRAYDFTAEDAAFIARDMRALADRGHGLAITLSRRSGPALRAAFAEALDPHPNAWLWDGEGDNPYFGLLAHADACLVTPDSVNMAVEAATAGRPVYLLPLRGGSAKFARLHAELIDRGFARDYKGVVAPWAVAPLDETARAARALAERIAQSLPECPRAAAGASGSAAGASQSGAHG